MAILFVAIAYIFLSKGKSLSIKSKALLLLSAPILLIVIYQVGLIKDPNRWGGVISRISVGFEGNPSLVYCTGIEALEEALETKGIEITPSIQKGLDSVVDGDGARIMAARSGISLMLENPMGINQSKQAYQQAIELHCGSKPKIFIAHAHNAWIDTALAIGIPGAILLLLTLINYAKLGCENLSTNPALSPYAMALFASACMWILRGLLDSTMRDQMLEMQAFIFSTLFGIILSKKTKVRLH